MRNGCIVRIINLRAVHPLLHASGQPGSLFFPGYFLSQTSIGTQATVPQTGLWDEDDVIPTAWDEDDVIPTATTTVGDDNSTAAAEATTDEDDVIPTAATTLIRWLLFLLLWIEQVAYAAA